MVSAQWNVSAFEIEKHLDFIDESFDNHSEHPIVIYGIILKSRNLISNFFPNHSEHEEVPCSIQFWLSKSIFLKVMINLPQKLEIFSNLNLDDFIWFSNVSDSINFSKPCFTKIFRTSIAIQKLYQFFLNV
jgi:hypothetical protein